MSVTISIQDALKAAVETLAPHGNNAALETEVLLAHTLEKPRSFLRAWPEQALQDAVRQRFFALISRRAAGEPIAYLTGHREFWSLDLRVTPHTLIPRPETEQLVELALAYLTRDNARIADLGTGSGAVALAIASERPHCSIVATDLCAHALAVAHGNAERLELRNIEFRRGDWCAPLEGETFDLIVSNPPYLAADDPHLNDLRNEPLSALIAGQSGLEMIAIIAKQAQQHLVARGWLLLEHGYTQSAEVAHLLQEAGYRHITTHQDVAGQARITLGQIYP